MDLNANAKELRKAHARLKVDVERYMGDLKHIMDKVWRVIVTFLTPHGKLQ